ncbi:MAG: ABC transporter ATP-binding protein, partial [Pseudomonadota bacterium]
ELIRAMSEDKLIVISTHILEEVEAVCTRAIIIADGRLLVDDTPAALAEQGDGDLDELFRRVTCGGAAAPETPDEATP